MLPNTEWYRPRWRCQRRPAPSTGRTVSTSPGSTERSLRPSTRSRPATGHRAEPAPQPSPGCVIHPGAVDRLARGHHPDHRAPTPASSASSRLAYSMANHKQLPPILSRVHPTRFTPYVSIALFGTITSILIFARPHRPAGRPLRVRRHDLVHRGPRLCRSARVKTPDLEGPEGAPQRQDGARLVPLTAVVGGIGTRGLVGGVATHVDGRVVGLSGWASASSSTWSTVSTKAIR